MKKTLGKEVLSIYEELEEYIRIGGFPGNLNYDSIEDRQLYVKNVLNDIFEKDIKQNSKIKNKEMFENVEKFIVNNFGAEISINSIVKYYDSINVNIDYRTVEKYINNLILNQNRHWKVKKNII